MPIPESPAFSAVIFDRRDPAQSQEIDRLIASGITLRDAVVPTDDLRRLRPALTDDELDEPPRWAYFAWQHSIVRILGPGLYRRVRLDRNRIKITGDEQERLSSRRIGIAGLSSGYSIALALVLEGLCGHLRLADFDTLELSNLNRVPLGLFEVGVNKAVAAARRISELDPYLSLEVLTDGVTATNADEFIDGLDMLLEQCDSFDMKVVLRDSARRQRVPVVMQTNDRGLLDVERFDLEPDRPLFHGLVDVDALTDVAELTPEQKTPLLLKIIDARQMSDRGAASLIELGRTVGQWPQLGSETLFGAAMVAAVARRIGLGRPLPSGRLRTDPDDLLALLAEPTPDPVPPGPAAPAELRPDADPLTTILHAASRAPSGGNTQPWRFRAGAARLIIEPAPTPSRMDVAGRGSLVAAGAAAFNARVAAAARGTLGPWHIHADQPPVNVEIDLTEGGFDPDLAALYQPMVARTANRSPGRRRELAAPVVAALTAAAAAEGAVLRLISDLPRLRALGEVLGEADRIRFLSGGLRQDMLDELSRPGLDRPDIGIDVRTLGLGAATSLLDLVARPPVMQTLRSLSGGSMFRDMTAARVTSASAVGVVVIDGDRVEDYVRGGAAMERVWIAATTAGLGVVPLSPAFLYARTPADLATLAPDSTGELADLQGRMNEIVGIAESQAPVLIMRFVHDPQEAPRSLRRPLSEVVISSENTVGTN